MKAGYFENGLTREGYLYTYIIVWGFHIFVLGENFWGEMRPNSDIYVRLGDLMSILLSA